MRTTTLVQLPLELLYHILAFLGAHDIVRMRQTSKALKALVDDSEMLQYIIDLCYFRMVQVGSYETDMSLDLDTPRKRLAQHEAAWQHIQYKRRRTFHFPASSVDRVIGGVYGSARGNHIYFERLPSALDPDDHSWSLAVDSTTLRNFTFCPEQDLLITVNYNQRDNVYNIHPKSLTTNVTHSETDYSVLKTTNHNPVDRLRIIGSYIILLFRDVIHQMSVADCMQILDWKSKNGYRCTHWFHEGINDYSFLAEDKFLVVTNGSMKIYSFSDKSKPLQCTAKLSLPSLMDDWLYHEAFTSINPIPCSVFPYSQKSPNQPSCFFRPSGDDQLVLIHIKVIPTMESESRRYFFFVRRSAILQLETLFSQQSNLTGLELPWSMWGPQHTTWFEQDCTHWQNSLYGFRTAGIYESPSDSSSRLFIRDFNPHISWNHHAKDTTEWRSQLVLGELTTVIRPPFTEPLGSALSYREIVSEERFDAEKIFMDESRVILQKTHLGLQKTIDVLVF